MSWGKRADLIVHEEYPFDAESPRAALAEETVTSLDAFYGASPPRGSEG